ncbi:AT-rich interactive domain-containing protein 2 [Linum grandiflorum]
MAGWSAGREVDEHAGGCDKTARITFRWNEFLVNLKSGTPVSHSFDNFLKQFLKETGSADCVKFFPPMLADGQCLNLLKLFLVVWEKGGYDVVSKTGLWSSVAQEFELDWSFGPYLKLVHVKYLSKLEKQLEDNLVSSEFIVKGILSEMKKSKSSELKSELIPGKKGDSSSGERFSSAVVETVEPGRRRKRLIKKTGMGSFLNGDNNCIAIEETMASGLTGSMKVGDVEDRKSVVVGTDRMMKFGGENVDNDDMMDHDVVEESVSSRKRKKDNVCHMLNWVRRVAQNPFDSSVEKLPEKSKWKSYGTDKLWKQVLQAREALLIKRDVASSPSSTGQENRMMHPCMYEDNSGTSYNFRDRSKSRRNLVSGGRPARRLFPPGTQSEPDSYTPGTYSGDSSSSEYKHIIYRPTKKAIPVGPAFQADLPKWVGATSKNEPQKWLGTQVWPLLSLPSKDIIERDPIGKGRQDSCGCPSPGSEECVRFHVKERNLKLKRELGTAFYIWGFNKMGEDVRLCWTEEEQKKFMAIASGITRASGRNVIDEVAKKFPRKRREDLVRYYFNVFLLWRRANQNRFTPDVIFTEDEDSNDEADEESAMSVDGSGSILGSAKKTRKKV